jgi:hypothetical protein
VEEEESQINGETEKKKKGVAEEEFKGIRMV